MVIGRRLSTPLLPHHLAYGSRTKAVRLVKLAFFNRMFRAVCQSDTIALLEEQPSRHYCGDRHNVHSRSVLLIHQLNLYGTVRVLGGRILPFI